MMYGIGIGIAIGVAIWLLSWYAKSASTTRSATSGGGGALTHLKWFGKQTAGASSNILHGIMAGALALVCLMLLAWNWPEAAGVFLFSPLTGAVLIAAFVGTMCFVHTSNGGDIAGGVIVLIAVVIALSYVPSCSSQKVGGFSPAMVRAHTSTPKANVASGDRVFEFEQGVERKVRIEGPYRSNVVGLVLMWPEGDPESVVAVNSSATYFPPKEIVDDLHKNPGEYTSRIREWRNEKNAVLRQHSPKFRTPFTAVFRSLEDDSKFILKKY